MAAKQEGGDNPSTAVVPSEKSIRKPAKVQPKEPPPRPRAPAAVEHHCSSAYEYVKDIQPYVSWHLQKILREKGMLQDGQGLNLVMPLMIKSTNSGLNGPKGDNLCSYKECWNPANCRESIASTMAYEAGGTIFWTVPTGVSCAIPLPKLSIAQANELMPLFEKNKELNRIFFPITLETSVNTPTELPVVPQQQSCYVQRHKPSVLFMVCIVSCVALPLK